MEKGRVLGRVLGSVLALPVTFPCPVSPVEETNYVCISRPREGGACLWGWKREIIRNTGSLVVHTHAYSVCCAQRFSAPP